MPPSFLEDKDTKFVDTIDDGRDVVANLQGEEELLGLKQSLAKALELPSITETSAFEIELYDSITESFRRLTQIDEVPATCCRLRIVTVQTDSKSNPGNQRQELLALPWREFSSSIDVDGKLVLKDGKHSVIIHEVSNSGLGTGTNIWDGAIALAKFLELHDRDQGDTNFDIQTDPTYSVRGKRILELGAGTGLVGIAAHVAFGAREVILTDLEYSLVNLSRNLSANACRFAGCPAAGAASIQDRCTIEARVLDWYDLQTCDEVLQKRSPPGPTTAATTMESTTTHTRDTGKAAAHPVWSPEIVLAADVVWVESLVRPLVRTLHHVCTKALSSPLILLSYQRRSQAVEDLLFRTLEEFSFHTEDVTSPVVNTTTGAASKIRIYRITYSTRILGSDESSREDQTEKR
jgi:predicted nicotinamide N-methyase